jgi:hypothetical protein
MEIICPLMKEKKRHRGAQDHPDELDPSRRLRGVFDRQRKMDFDHCALPSLTTLMTRDCADQQLQ